MSFDLNKIKNHQPHLIGEESFHKSAVLIPLIPTETGYNILFEIRSSKINRQPGDICFPGGMLNTNELPKEAAIRETCEELLISSSQIELIGPTDYLHSASLLVYPYIGIINDYTGTFSKDEVSETFQIPLGFFLKNKPTAHIANWEVSLSDNFPFEKIRGGKEYKWRERKDEILFYEYENYVIWGITAKILHAFTQTL